MQWCLEAVTDADSKWLVNIKSVPLVIGRADDCDLKLSNGLISRHHSEIRISSDLMWIRDLKSTNGTYVNQNKVKNAQLLEPNDTISIGNYKFKVKTISSSISTKEPETIPATYSKDFINFDLSSFEPKLRMLIHDRNVIPHFQPILKFPDMAEVGYEILGRVGNEGLPSNPAELLELAECLGCGSELSSLFRETGVELGKHIHGSPLLFVNSCEFEINGIDDLLASMQRIRDIAPSNKIVLEINEKTAAETNNLILLRDALEKMDMGLAFDDFGVGQTRLVELSNTPPDYLKFDISLIRKIHLAPKRLHQMVSTFINASHDLGILTLAEGIECSEEAKVCQELGFDLGQGYFFGRPAPIDALKINIE
ncbi:EAL domain-containing protein [uncultured Desulfosarcina sp.]|uniref:EAL domain-containing protein n=1 Tax=uncultured Desulfosarcina sp. TaxID=218289 RepID=UPI0029C786C7|nr:EAL domain-containing protein [uncultured Desulfosarcina sp.]